MNDPIIDLILESRSASERLRAESERVLTAAANSMVKSWNGTNQAFSVRISECSDTHAKLQGHLSLTLQVLQNFKILKHVITESVPRSKGSQNKNTCAC